jgi:tRNA 5-methylaminomethyl-2-thiouridine biosynthesis bifunctional protein
VGAGLAGAHVAQALARRGILVTVLEAESIAGGGSGNLQGITYTRLSHQHNPLTDFSIAAFSYATDYYRCLTQAGQLLPDTDIGLGGYIQLHEHDDTLAHLEQVLGLAPDFARVVSAREIAAITGIQPRCGGIHYQRGGWIDPRALCRALLDHPLITVKERCGAISLSRRDGQWSASSPTGAHLAQAPAAVLATARHAVQQTELSWLPLNTIRGQTTHVPATKALLGVTVPVCDEGYLPPARNGVHCIGASFGPGDERTDERNEDHAHNIEMMRRALPTLALVPPPEGWRGHVALRCNSNDYLPVAGMVPRINDFNRRYSALQHDRKRVIDTPAPLHAGLAVLTSLGSRGLTAAPLAAARLVDQLLGRPPCLPRYLQRAISPARFAERALKRSNAL